MGAADVIVKMRAELDKVLPAKSSLKERALSACLTMEWAEAMRCVVFPLLDGGKCKLAVVGTPASAAQAILEIVMHTPQASVLLLTPDERKRSAMEAVSKQYHLLEPNQESLFYENGSSLGIAKEGGDFRSVDVVGVSLSRGAVA